MQASGHPTVIGDERNPSGGEVTMSGMRGESSYLGGRMTGRGDLQETVIQLEPQKDTFQQESVPRGGEIALMQQDGPLPAIEAEGSLPVVQGPAAEAVRRDGERLSPFWELISILMVCAVAGVVGTHIRVELEEAFGKHGLYIVKHWDSLFQDLPPNMAGCFFMGIVGVACKAHIARYSELISLGLSTGLMGSITTYASWNQSMTDLFVARLWAKALFGILLGLELPFASLIVGVHAGKGILWACSRRKHPLRISPDNLVRRKVVGCSAAFLWLGILLPLNVLMAAFKWGDTARHVQAIGACIAPLGVWLRWYLSRFNGSFLKGSAYGWIPWGTLAANVLASVLVTVEMVADVQISSHVGSVWLEACAKGFMGCLSTVSTFMVEVVKLAEGKSIWKAYCYIGISLLITQLLGLILYGIPVWIEGYPRAYPDPQTFQAG